MARKVAKRGPFYRLEREEKRGTRGAEWGEGSALL